MQLIAQHRGCSSCGGQHRNQPQGEAILQHVCTRCHKFGRPIKSRNEMATINGDWICNDCKAAVAAEQKAEQEQQRNGRASKLSCLRVTTIPCAC